MIESVLTCPYIHTYLQAVYEYMVRLCNRSYHLPASLGLLPGKVAESALTLSVPQQHTDIVDTETGLPMCLCPTEKLVWKVVL